MPHLHSVYDTNMHFKIDPVTREISNQVAAMLGGTVPPQLLSDAVHYTSATKTVIGNLIYKRCCELGIFEA